MPDQKPAVGERDPRVDPKPGDVLRKPDFWRKDGVVIIREIRVISVGHGAVRVKSEPPLPNDVNILHHADWHFLMRNAEVIQRAE